MEYSVFALWRQWRRDDSLLAVYERPGVIAMAKITGYGERPQVPRGLEGTCNLCKARVETEGNEVCIESGKTASTDTPWYRISCPGCNNPMIVLDLSQFRH